MTKQTLFQLGGHRLKLQLPQADWVFQYTGDANLEDTLTKLQPLNQSSDRLFLIPRDSKMWQKVGWLKRLPAHQIVYDQRQALSGEIKKDFELKGACGLDFTNQEALTQTLSQNFFFGQSGFNIPISVFQLNPNTGAVITQQGTNGVIFKGAFSEPTLLLSCQVPYALGANWQMSLFQELEVLSGDLTFKLRMKLVDYRKHELVQSATLDRADSGAPIEFSVPTIHLGCFVELWVQGASGSLWAGHLHLRRSRGNAGTLLVGGQRLAETRKRDLLYYFNAGDQQPPLCVYFSGYRQAEGFEGDQMMRRFAAPYLLFSDPRLEGGNFYIGSQASQSAIVEVIQATLKKLGFAPDDLILSGLSMGSFAALYYAVDLKPKAVIAGKPLTDIGGIARNGRILRPADFETALDILLENTGEVSGLSAHHLDQLFWRHFQLGDFEKTLFALAYMKEDDYDQAAFGKIFTSLKQRFPLMPFIYKGFTGRHNDDTSEIVSWFTQQYQSILNQTFHRHGG